MSLAPFVQILGRGQGRSRSLTQDEAFAAVQIILDGNAAPEAIGALLMLLRMKGETADELAGFVQAARRQIDWTATPPALDWPSYAAGRTRGLPWFLLSAKLVAQAGYPVLLHGWNSHQNSHADVRQGLARVGIAESTTHADAQAALSTKGIAYLPLERLSPSLFALLRLRDVLGLRSCINTVLRLLNPARAEASVQGVFHPSYREIQADACRIMGQHNITVIKGGGGEFERHPGKDTYAFGLRDGLAWTDSFQSPNRSARRLGEVTDNPAHLAGLWEGSWRDPFAQSVVISTAALALHTLGADEPDRLADDLWTQRLTAKAA